MSDENKKTAPESAASNSAASNSSVSDDQLENVAGGRRKRRSSSGQVSLNDPVADLNGDGNVTLHEVVTFNRDQRDKN